MEGWMISHSTFKAIEFVMLFGLCFLFGWHQLRSLDKADREAKERKLREAAKPAE
jgi:hypothetical protein